MSTFPAFQPIIGNLISLNCDGVPCRELPPSVLRSGSIDSANASDRGVIGGTTTTYFLRGFYVTGNTFEFWTSTNSIQLTPPSGHTLIDITVTSKRRR